MNYISRIILILSTMLVFFHSNAQKGFYIGASGGYGLTIGGKSNTDVSVYQMNSTYYYNYKSNPLNVGHGFVPSILVGYFFNKHIGAELGFGYLFGAKHVSSFSRLNLLPNDGTVDPTLPYIPPIDSYASVYRFNSFLINPSFILKVPFGIWSPYVRMGILFGIANSLTLNTDLNYTPYYSEVNKGGLTSGFTATLGLEMKLKDRIGIFGECTFRYANYCPGSYTANYTISYPQGSIYSKDSFSGNYVDNISISSNNSVFSPSTSTNNDRFLMYYAANALCFSLGLRYYLKKDSGN